jgi:hypothetical protein
MEQIYSPLARQTRYLSEGQTKFDGILGIVKNVDGGASSPDIPVFLEYCDNDVLSEITSESCEMVSG